MAERIAVLLILFTSCFNDCQGTGGEFSFASYYSNKMVLQQLPKSAVIWGYSSLTHGDVFAYIGHKEVTNGHIRPNGSGIGGVWYVKLPPHPAGGPYDIFIKGDEGAIRLHDVLFGDVWICGGEENMHFALSKIFNATEEIEDAIHYPDIRIAHTHPYMSNKTLIDFGGPTTTWRRMNDTFGSFSAVCWLYGKFLYKRLNYPIGLFLIATVVASPLDEWASPKTLDECKPQNSSSRKQNEDEMELMGVMMNEKKHDMFSSSRYNAMIHPLLRMTIYGMIWYQGESNKWSFMTYNCTLSSLIRDWRTSFHEGSGGETSAEFPFGIVQLSSEVNGSNTIHGYPEVRWYQTAGYGFAPNPSMQNVFMAVTMDLGQLSESENERPRDKQDVALRLGAAGMTIAYKQEVKFQGPYPVYLEDNTESRQLEVKFDGALDVRTDVGFEICCSPNPNTTCWEGHMWFESRLKLFNAETILLPYNASLCYHKVRGLRYAWRGAPCDFKKCALYGLRTDLPVPPFLKMINLYPAK